VKLNQGVPEERYIVRERLLRQENELERLDLSESTY